MQDSNVVRSLFCRFFSFLIIFFHSYTAKLNVMVDRIVYANG